MVVSKFIFVLRIKFKIDSVFLLDAEYIPKSYYLIDRFGHKSDVYLLRNKRELMPLLRNRRFASSGSQSGSASFASSGAGSSDDIHFQIPDFTGIVY